MRQSDVGMDLPGAAAGSRREGPPPLALAGLLALLALLVRLGVLVLLAGCGGRITSGATDPVPPQVSITWPPAGSVTSSIAEIITVQAQDSVGVTRVDTYVNGALLEGRLAPPYRCLWLTAGLTAGSSHTIIARALDAAGNSAADTVTVTVGARRLTRITSDPEEDFSPAWSPEGSRLAVSSFRSGNQDIRLIGSSGDDQGPVASHPAHDASPAWSPDGSLIAFASDRTGNWSIHLAPAGGGAATRLTTSMSDDENPAWSPDGMWVAFDSDRSGVKGIWRIPPTGGTAGAVDVSLTSAADPAYSSGGVLVYGSARRGVTDLWLLGPGDPLPLPLTGYSQPDYAPDWSPTGSHVVYVTEQFGDPELVIISAEGGSPIRLTNHLATDEDPAWAPDGRTIAFSSDRGGNRDIWLLD